MTLLSLARFVAAILAALVLAAAGYLLWTWYAGDWVRNAEGQLEFVREPWRLWTGGALLAWSLLGRFVIPLVLARPGAMPVRQREGAIIPGASGSSIYLESVGREDGIPLIMTHGWGMDGSFWDLACRDLGDRFRLVIWDLPGLGHSKLPANNEVRLENFAADLRGLLQALDRPAVLVGHSIGGMTIQTLIRDHSDVLDRLAGVVLLNTTYTNPLRTILFAKVLHALQKPVLEPMARLTIWLHPLVWLSKWNSYLSGSTHMAMRLGFGKFVTRGQLERVALLATKAPPAVESKGDLAMFRWDATGALRDLSIPLLVIGGDLDIVTKLEASHIIAAATPLATLTVASGANHMGPLECAGLYDTTIANFAVAAVADMARRRAPLPPAVNG